MTELIILGSGSGFATRDRFCTSVGLLHDERLYLFDCGEPCTALLFRAGIDPLALKTLFISHMHPDHVGGLASLLFSMYLPGRTGRKYKDWSIDRNDRWYRDSFWFPPAPARSEHRHDEPAQVNIIMPQEGIAPIQTYLAAVYLAPELLPFDLDFQPTTEGETYRDDQVSVSAVSNKHLSGNFAHQSLKTHYPLIALESYSYGVDVGGKRFVFSGDIDRLDELTPLMDGVETLVVEVAHFPPETIRPFLDSTDLKQLVLTHIHPGLEARIKTLVHQWNDPRITIATDGLRIPL